MLLTILLFLVLKLEQLLSLEHFGKRLQFYIEKQIGQKTKKCLVDILDIIMMYIKTWCAESTDTKNLEQIRCDLEQMQERLLAGEMIPSDENLLIQDAIFTHRKNSFSIPSIYYTRHRKENESDMHVFAFCLAEQLAGC